MNRVAVCLGMALVLAAIAWGTVQATEPAKGSLVVGVVLPFSGPLAPFGEIEKNAFLMGMEEINAAGGVKGRPITLLFEDDGSTFDRGRAAAEKLIAQHGAIVLTGGYSSPVAFAVAALAQRRQVPFLVTTGSADEITEQGWDYVFRINQPVSDYAKSLIDFFREVVQPERVAIIYENSMFGQSGSREFTDEILEIGWKIVSSASYEPGATDFKPIINQAKASNPDVVYMIAYVNEAARLMRQAKDLDFNPKIFAGAAAGFTVPEFGKLAGDAAENVVSASLWTPQVSYPGAKEFAEKYRNKFGVEAGYHAAEAYASIYVVADALKRAKELTPKGIREALTKTNMMTAFGPVKFGSHGKKTQQNALPTYVVQWQKGSLESIWPPVVAAKPYVYPIPRWPK